MVVSEMSLDGTARLKGRSRVLHTISHCVEIHCKTFVRHVLLLLLSFSKRTMASKTKLAFCLKVNIPRLLCSPKGETSHDEVI